jgi:flagellar motor component MotA
MTITLDHIKLASKIIVWFSTAHVAGSIIRANTNPETAFQAAQVFVGGTVIGTIVSDYSMKYVEAAIDNFAEQIKEAKEKKAKKEATT